MPQSRPPNDKTALTVPPPSSLARVRFVLVKPRTAVNIGAAARAMSTMGLTELILVQPLASPRSPEACSVAHNAVDVLDAAREAGTVVQAFSDAVLVVGTTNRRRSRVAPDPAPIREVAARIAEVAQERTVAVLFGNEETGLETDALSYCHLLATIPTVPTRPALNLSHAVMIVAYEIFLASLAAIPTPVPDLATAAELEALCLRISRLMLRLGFRPHEDDPETFLASLRRVVNRMTLERKDIRTLHVVLRALESQMGR